MYIVCITGASGVILGLRLIEELVRNNFETGVIVSESAQKVIAQEIFNNEKTYSGITNLLIERGCKVEDGLIHEYNPLDFFEPVASGSTYFEAAIIVPCSMKTLGSIANGISSNLINRVADIALKESRRLILVPRETPLSYIHLKNMVTVKQAGTDIVLPVVEFYTAPRTVDEMIDFIVGKILNLLNIKHSLFKAWQYDKN